MTASEAAATLGVSRQTLYAYVSRGFLSSQSMPGSSRQRGYGRDDVERLQQRREARKHPDEAAAHALRWGVPLLESAITMIDGRRLYYRGHDAAMLARTRSVREIASLIWTGGFDAPELRHAPAIVDVKNAQPDAPFAARAQFALVRTAVLDPLATDLRPERVARGGWSILHLMTRAATGVRSSDRPIDEQLAAAWRAPAGGVDLIRAALILCADHELNVSSFTARCVASAGSTPYAVVVAGLSALEGPRHGGVSARVEALLMSMRRARDPRASLADRLRRGESLDGFGHPLYPHGDPRATALMDLLEETYPKSRERAFVRAFADAAASLRQDAPTIDFALAAVARVLRLPAESPLMLFAIGRTIGWIGHAIEQYGTGQLIRPRAKYVGVVPT